MKHLVNITKSLGYVGFRRWCRGWCEGGAAVKMIYIDARKTNGAIGAIVHVTAECKLQSSYARGCHTPTHLLTPVRKRPEWHACAPAQPIIWCLAAHKKTRGSPRHRSSKCELCLRMLSADCAFKNRITELTLRMVQWDNTTGGLCKEFRSRSFGLPEREDIAAQKKT